MTLQQIHYAIAISEAGSLNKAAENLYVSQPSLSAFIRDLETDGDISDRKMEIGYIMKKNQVLSKVGSAFIQETEKYLMEQAEK